MITIFLSNLRRRWRERRERKRRLREGSYARDVVVLAAEIRKSGRFEA